MVLISRPCLFDPLGHGILSPHSVMLAARGVTHAFPISRVSFPDKHLTRGVLRPRFPDLIEKESTQCNPDHSTAS